MYTSSKIIMKESILDMQLINAWGDWHDLMVSRSFNCLSSYLFKEMHLVVYVYGIVIIGSDQYGIWKLKQHHFGHFHKKDLGKLKYFQGTKVAHSNSRL